MVSSESCEHLGAPGNTVILFVDTAKSQLTEDRWMEYLQRWGADDSEHVILYTGALYKAILGQCM